MALGARNPSRRSLTLGGRPARPPPPRCFPFPSIATSAKLAAVALVLLWSTAGLTIQLRRGSVTSSTKTASYAEGDPGVHWEQAQSASDSDLPKPPSWERPELKGLKEPCDGGKCSRPRRDRGQQRAAGATLQQQQQDVQQQEETEQQQEAPGQRQGQVQHAEGRAGAKDGADASAVLIGFRRMGAKDETQIKGDAAMKAVLAKLREG